ncbi:TPA: hypothetical protein O8U03_004353 [Enterobacter asburiae]|nr:hypothetical protein [Enterobacter asburiae]
MSRQVQSLSEQLRRLSVR